MLLRLYGPKFFNRLLVVLILLWPSRSIIAGCDPLTTLLMMMLLTVLQYVSICHHHIDTDTGTGTGTNTDTDTSMYIRSCSCLSDTGISINMFWSSSAFRIRKVVLLLLLLSVPEGIVYSPCSIYSGDCIPIPSAATIKLILILLRSVYIDSVPSDITYAAAAAADAE